MARVRERMPGLLRGTGLVLRRHPLKGVRRIQQTFIDTCCRIAFAKLYSEKTPITAADLLNDRVLPYYEDHGLPLLRILTDRGTDYQGKYERQPYALYLVVKGIEHTRTKNAEAPDERHL